MSCPARATYTDILAGKPANGLVWTLDGGIGNGRPPRDECFVTRDGLSILRSDSLDRKTRREKDRPRPWYVSVYDNTEYAVTEEGECDVFTWRTPVGTAIGRRQQNHFTEYPLKTVADLDTWIHVYENLRFEPNAEWLAKTEPAGLPSFGLSWSPVQQLLQFDTGLENFYYFLMDAPDTMARLLEVMQERCLDRLRLGLSLFPNVSSVYWGENTSSTSISPPYYRQHSLPHVRDYARLVHRSNARLVVHMCGLLKDLLDDFVETGMDGIHSVTPPPIGDTPYRLIRDRFAADFTIIGRLNAQLWAGKNRDDIQAVMREMFWPELLQSPFALIVTTDCMPDITRQHVSTLYDALETMRW